MLAARSCGLILFRLRVRRFRFEVRALCAGSDELTESGVSLRTDSRNLQKLIRSPEPADAFPIGDNPPGKLGTDSGQRLEFVPLGFVQVERQNHGLRCIGLVLDRYR